MSSDSQNSTSIRPHYNVSNILSAQTFSHIPIMHRGRFFHTLLWIGDELVHGELLVMR